MFEFKNLVYLVQQYILKSCFGNTRGAQILFASAFHMAVSLLPVPGTSGSPHAAFATQRAFRALSLPTGCQEAASKEGFLRRALGLL